jgi:hypothetical protein
VSLYRCAIGSSTPGLRQARRKDLLQELDDRDNVVVNRIVVDRGRQRHCGRDHQWRDKLEDRSGIERAAGDSSQCAPGLELPWKV